MNNETLDALLIDRSLGALPPDTEALLDAFLEQNPSSAKRQELTCDIVGLARQSFRNEELVPLPEFRAPQWVHRRKQRHYTLQITGMAATLAIGLGLGLHLSHARPSERTTSPPIAMTIIRKSSPEVPHGIWSAKHKRAERNNSSRSALKWTSPIRKPELITQGEQS